jgi:hypothetical protein
MRFRTETIRIGANLRISPKGAAAASRQVNSTSRTHARSIGRDTRVSFAHIDIRHRVAFRHLVERTIVDR